MVEKERDLDFSPTRTHTNICNFHFLSLSDTPGSSLCFEI